MQKDDEGGDGTCLQLLGCGEAWSTELHPSLW